MNQSTEQRLAQERLRRQANKGSASLRGNHKNNDRTSRAPSSPSSHAYWIRAVTSGNVPQVQAWIQYHANDNDTTTCMAAPQRARFQQSLDEGFQLARQQGHDKVAQVIRNVMQHQGMLVSRNKQQQQQPSLSYDGSRVGTDTTCHGTDPKTNHLHRQ